jgi:hypothetical protein
MLKYKDIPGYSVYRVDGQGGLLTGPHAEVGWSDLVDVAAVTE